MMTPRSREVLLRALLVAAAGAAAPAFAQSYSAHGQIGYLQEWEMRADLTKTTSGANIDYAGPVTLRHVGLCSANGVEEKTGTVELKIVPKAPTVQGTLAMKDDNCRIVVSAAPSFAGSMNCRDGQGVPISLSIEALPPAEHVTSAEAK